MSNAVTDIDLTRALPDPLKNDENILALGRVIAGELQENIRLARLATIYARIDELPEPVLDILAYDLHVDWYDCDSPVGIKRSIIKGSVKVHKYLGTKYAVESVVRAYFGSGTVEEWHEYGGRPHRFRITSDNPSIENERAEQFFRILEVVKRKSSWLDEITITLTGAFSLFFGVIIKDTNREKHFFGPTQERSNLYCGALIAERSNETHTIGEDLQ